jgi:hypothetical protein
MAVITAFLDMSDFITLITLATIATNYESVTLQANPKGTKGLAEITITCLEKDADEIEMVLEPFM